MNEDPDIFIRVMVNSASIASGDAIVGNNEDPEIFIRVMVNSANSVNTVNSVNLANDVKDNLANTTKKKMDQSWSFQSKLSMTR